MSQDSSYDFSEIAKCLHATNIEIRHMKNNIKQLCGEVGWGGKGVKVFGNGEAATKNNLE